MLPTILDAWGGISSKDGFLSRAAGSIAIGDAEHFLRWFHSQKPTLVNRNN